ncbi:hypothetical protein LPB03_07065 [Polaribacter vadi]|uniref:Uncharacterized protein n=1 Tax=Polaribacter vadi TaxID=1774273 RepID=A0A1B8TZ34_9FLAO|nr:GNAT family N-acetyltransferase [Polaribacter vadi]AOW17239.1 hypothetical protein LPB03_07065 [Polaribacter vadi]OBY64834.1 hypothetical protein LPB3_05425 [Polaribacter vadi]
MNEFKKYPLQDETLDKFKTCFDLNGSPKKTENIKWQFLNNSEKNSIVHIAFDEENNRTAGIYALFCVKFKIKNKTYTATQSLDTMTDVNYRGQGLFIKLAKDVYNKAEEKGISLVYGFPNGNSIYSFRKRLGWEVLDPVPFVIKPLRSRYFTDKISVLSFLPDFKLSFFSYKKNNKFQIKEENKFPDDVNTIWKNFSKNINVAIHRDKAYLEWRYIQKPNENYKISHCYDLNCQYLGFVIYTVKEKHNGKIAYIMELMYNLEEPKVGKLLLNYAIDRIKKEKADCILAWSFEHSPNHKIFKKQFFLKMPEKLKPIELHFGARSFNKNLTNIINKRENWFISYSDSDTV